jgi:hypothetical protein
MVCIKRVHALWNAIVYSAFTPFFIWGEAAIAQKWSLFSTSWFRILYEQPMTILERLQLWMGDDWKLRLLLFFVLANILFSLVTIFFIFKAKRVSRFFFGALIAQAILFSIWLLWYTNQKYLLFGILLYSAIGYMIWDALRQEVLSPYYLSRVPWWEGFPRKRIPMKAEFEVEGDSIEAFPTHLTNKGGFFFFEKNPSISKLQRSPIQIRLKYKKKWVNCHGRVYSVDPARNGAGIAFHPLNKDSEKKLDDFFTDLYRYGWVESML